MRRILHALCALSLAAAAPAGASPVDPALATALAEAAPGSALRVEVVLRGGESLPPPGAQRRAAVAALQAPVLAALPAPGWQTIHRYRSIAALAGRATAGAVAVLAARPEVLRVSLDGTLRVSLNEGRALIGADVVHFQGLSGEGVVVAVLDTGIDTDHPDLADDLIDEVCFCSPTLGCCPDGSASDDSAEDDHGHGTSVAGIVSSAGAVAPLGVAPDAKLIGAKVLSASGSGNFSDTAAALDWLLTHHVPGPPLVVNLSLGDGGEFDDANQGSCGSSPTRSAVVALHAAGVPVIVASGNEGHDDGISFPACIAQAISVGGVYDADVGNVGWCGELPLCLFPACSDDSGADVFVCHSNSGALLDVLAPNYRTRTSAMGGGVETSFGGTSAASPYAAGQAALLLEADPSLTPAELHLLLTGFGPLVSNPDNGQSYPRTDIDAAVSSLPEPGATSGLAAGLLALWGLSRRPTPWCWGAARSGRARPARVRSGDRSRGLGSSRS